MLAQVCEGFSVWAGSGSPTDERLPPFLTALALERRSALGLIGDRPPMRFRLRLCLPCVPADQVGKLNQARAFQFERIPPQPLTRRDRQHLHEQLLDDLMASQVIYNDEDLGGCPTNRENRTGIYIIARKHHRIPRARSTGCG